MSKVNLIIAFVCILLITVLTACPAPVLDDTSSDTTASSQPVSETRIDTATQTDATTADSADSNGDSTGEIGSSETPDSESEPSESTSADESGSESESSQAPVTDALNPFPPDGSMWTYDDLGKKQNEKVLVLCETDKGNILFEIYPEIAPNSAKAFLKLVKDEYYNNTYFHRIIKDFVAQGGSPLNSIDLKQYSYNKENWPTKVKEKVALEKGIGVINDEPNYANNDPGTISLAKVGYDKDTYKENSAGAEFFINLKFNADLDKHFTVFGKVVSGMDVVKKLSQDDLIRSMREMH